MRCKHCGDPCHPIPFPWTGPNKMSGTDYVSHCCWEDLVDDNDPNKPANPDEVYDAIRERKTTHDR